MSLRTKYIIFSIGTALSSASFLGAGDVPTAVPVASLPEAILVARVVVPEVVPVAASAENVDSTGVLLAALESRAGVLAVRAEDDEEEVVVTRVNEEKKYSFKK